MAVFMSVFTEQGLVLHIDDFAALTQHILTVAWGQGQG